MYISKKEREIRKWGITFELMCPWREDKHTSYWIFWSKKWMPWKWVNIVHTNMIISIRFFIRNSSKEIAFKHFFSKRITAFLVEISQILPFFWFACNRKNSFSPIKLCEKKKKKKNKKKREIWQLSRAGLDPLTLWCGISCSRHFWRVRCVASSASCSQNDRGIRCV